MNLTLSKRGDYVVRSAICLAGAYDSGTTKKLREISQEMVIPRTFISQILGDLVKAKLAVSTFGRDGGFRLNRAPGDVTLLEVVEAGEGPLIAERCALGEGPCRWDAVCPLHESWSEATASLRSILAKTTLLEVLERDQAIKSLTYPVPSDTHRIAKHSVRINDSIQVEQAINVVTTRFDQGGSWLSAHAEGAFVDEESILLRVGPGGPGWLEKTVLVRLEPAQRDANGLVTIPIAWEATGFSGLFPRLEGALNLRELDPRRTEMTLVGQYRPPLGRAGFVLDDAVLSHAAHATIRSFLRRVANVFEEDIATDETHRSSPTA